MVMAIIPILPGFAADQQRPRRQDQEQDTCCDCNDHREALPPHNLWSRRMLLGKEGHLQGVRRGLRRGNALEGRLRLLPRGQGGRRLRRGAGPDSMGIALPHRTAGAKIRRRRGPQALRRGLLRMLMGRGRQRRLVGRGAGLAAYAVRDGRCRGLGRIGGGGSLGRRRGRGARRRGGGGHGARRLSNQHCRRDLLRGLRLGIRGGFVNPDPDGRAVRRRCRRGVLRLGLRGGVEVPGLGGGAVRRRWRRCVLHVGLRGGVVVPNRGGGAVRRC
mmetsp:Transcript_161301/g.517818  ORF Transcript_161301/g.517818 Transcript_161301/m.517818 type:complete len:273 (-) Transcript_161301:689-1507(-)